MPRGSSTPPPEYLLIDISNSFTKFASSSPRVLRRVFRIPTPKLTRRSLAGMARPGQKIVLSSVVPEKGRLAESAFFRQAARGDLLIVSHRLELGAGIDYPRPSTIGADRLANAAAARDLYGAPAVVVDFGTAVTFDILSSAGCYIGGVIAPGLEVMTDYLFQRTALLPRIRPIEPASAIGRSTRAAMLAGAVFGYRGLVREILAQIRLELGSPRRLHIIATGGYASLISGRLPEIKLVHPNLTLEGLRIIGNLNFPNMKTAIGIDFGGTTIKSAIIQDGKLIEQGQPIETMHTGDSTAIIEALLARIAQLRGICPEIAAIGVGLPGITDSVHGIVHNLSNVPGWNDVPLRDLLGRRTGLHAEIENDANCMTYAEWKFGAARNDNHVVCVTLGTGVGGGLILNGRLYRGAFLGAGEIGQMSIDYHGRTGNYGNLGALEKYVGNAQIAERGQRSYEEAGKLVPLDQCTPAALEAAAHAGDPIAKQLWSQLGKEIGCALANVVWLLNPDSIVIGGGVAKAGDLLFEPIRQTIRSATMPTFYENLKILPAALGNEAGVIGSATIALDSMSSAA